MEQRSQDLGLLFISVSCLLLLLCCAGSVEAYKNYTVGESLGWFDNIAKPSVNYQKWVANKKFSLGDFLIFNTDNNRSVVQTYNLTTYKRCDYEDALDNDTMEWSATNPSSTTPEPVSVAVPLLKIGVTYFFSGDYDGWQCEHGQHFKINVTYGQGLPPSLRDPSDESPAPTNPDSGDNESAPDTLVPSNFNHPQDSSDDEVESGSASLSVFLRLFGWPLNGALILLALVCT